MTVNVGYSIADISAIKSLPTALLVNGYARLCRSTNAWFSYDPTSTVTADDISVLLPSSGTGRWLKLKADAVSGLVNPMTTIGDIIVAAASGTPSRVGGNNTTTQKYLSQYATPVLWTPASTTTALWLDAADSSTITTVSGAVSQWNDKSGNNRNATQFTSTNRPLITTSGLNGLNVITFDGTNDYFEADLGSISQSYMVFFCGRANGNTAGGAVSGSYIFDSKVGESTRTIVTFNPNGTSSADNGKLAAGVIPNIITTSGVISYNAPTILSIVFDGASSYIYSEGSLSLSGTLATGSLTKIILGQRQTLDSAVTALNGYFADFVIIAGNNSAIRQKAEGYLAHKWGLTDNLPSDHPYKSTPPTTGSTGTLTTAWNELENSGVTAGSYMNANVTVDSKGRVVSATNGSTTVAVGGNNNIISLVSNTTLQVNKNYFSNLSGIIGTLPSTATIGDYIELYTGNYDFIVLHGGSTDVILNNTTLTNSGVSNGIVLKPYSFVKIVYIANNLWKTYPKVNIVNNTNGNPSASLLSYTPTSSMTSPFGTPLAYIYNGIKIPTGNLSDGFLANEGSGGILITVANPILLSSIKLWNGQGNVGVGQSANFSVNNLKIYRGTSNAGELLGSLTFTNSCGIEQSKTLTESATASTTFWFAFNTVSAINVGIMELEIYGRQLGEIIV